MHKESYEHFPNSLLLWCFCILLQAWKLKSALVVFVCKGLTTLLFILVWYKKKLSAADGLVSYSAPSGQQMNSRGQQIYLNDTVYDGSISYR